MSKLTVGTASAALLLAGWAVAPGAQAAEKNERWDMLDKYCVRCHNDIEFKGKTSFESLNLDDLHADAKTWEGIARKLRLGSMPPRDVDQPDRKQVQKFVVSLESDLDSTAKAKPNTGAPILHRLNRTEYANAIRDVLGLAIDPAGLIPPDDSSGGFDNMAQVLTITPALLEGYLSASAKVAAMAIGDPAIRPVFSTYRAKADQSQDSAIEGAPLGTMGGLVIDHYFPLDGEYLFEPKLYRGILAMVRGLETPNTLEITIDKQRIHVANFGGHEDNVKSHANAYATADEVDGRLSVRVPVKAGPHRITVTFLRKPLVQSAEVWQQYQRTLIDSNEDKGTPHLDKVNIVGPYNAAGAGPTPSRQKIFACRPASAAKEEACATEILSGLSRRAWRRPIEKSEIAELMSFYKLGRESGSFDNGIEIAVRRVISGPEFLFRAEADPPGLKPGTPYRITDLELASRLSFFLWSTVPDEELITVASKGRLKNPKVLEAQVKRMLADPKSKTLVTNFASQWLTLRNLQSVVPDPALFPDFDNNLREGFIQETEMLVESVIKEDRNVVDLLNADYTFVNERLARHYGIPGVYGNRFRRVQITDEARRGLLGQGSFLTLTSVATRTSAVQRGKWVLTNLLASPPPAPPPNVPALEASAGGEPKTLREQLSAHRADPVCSACHKVMDPIGFSLENYDAVGRWRDKDKGLKIDATDVAFDGTEVGGVAGLRSFLLGKQDLFVRALTEKMMSFALGREVDYYDMPAVRTILHTAASQQNRFSAIVMGIVTSDAFMMRTVAPRADGVLTTSVESEAPLGR
ncbi:MAG: DUF1592 domain-containing protein [Steroidobacteraceae bacterium]